MCLSWPDRRWAPIDLQFWKMNVFTGSRVWSEAGLVVYEFFRLTRSFVGLVWMSRATIWEGELWFVPNFVTCDRCRLNWANLLHEDWIWTHILGYVVWAWAPNEIIFPLGFLCRNHGGCRGFVAKLFMLPVRFDLFFKGTKKLGLLWSFRLGGERPPCDHSVCLVNGQSEIIAHALKFIFWLYVLDLASSGCIFEMERWLPPL